MKRGLCLLALLLVACQPQASPRPSTSPQVIGEPGDLIYVQDQHGTRMLALDWSGKVVGWVAAANFATPAADGSKFLRTGDQLSMEDLHGHRLGQLDPGLDAYTPAIWADDNTHLCGVSFPSTTGAATGQGSLWIAAPGEKVRVVGPVGIPGSEPGVVSCSIANNRAIVAGGAMPHWPPGATRYLITTEVAAFNLTTGALEYHRVYPQGNMGGQLDVGPRGEWVLVTPSPDGGYLAESGIFNNTTLIRDITTDKPVASFTGSVTGFSSDGSRVVVDAGDGGSAEVQVMAWRDQHVIWRKPGQATGVLARPGSTDLLVVIPNATGNFDLHVVTTAGEATIARNVWVLGMCPCHPGA